MLSGGIQSLLNENLFNQTGKTIDSLAVSIMCQLSMKMMISRNFLHLLRSEMHKNFMKI